MNAKARKVHRIVVGFGVACAMAAALPCVADDAPPVDTVTVKSKSAPAEENIGFFSGLAIGAVAGGPIGAVVGGVTGALLGEHYHKQKVANHELAADLSGSNAEKAKLHETVLQLDGSLQLSQEQQAVLAASLVHARELTLNVPFKTGDANPTADDIDRLTALGQLAKAMDGVRIQVSGYADPRGSQEYNAALSKDRAESVAAVLKNAGVNQDRIVIEALGANGAGETGDLDDYAFQRRVSVKLLGNGEPPDSTKAAAATVAQVQ
jgi:outer membrane protein OmpA-like peptidoglycan-associated protein